MPRLSAPSPADVRPRIDILRVIVLVAALAGCSTGSPVGTSAPLGTAVASASSAPATTPQTSATPVGSQAAQPAAGGGATDFCSAFKEYRTATQEGTPDAEGAGYRAAATDLRTYAPAEIKVAAGLLADVVDEVGQSILAGQPAPEILGQGQSAERRQALFDVSKWMGENCP
jgi:hypothetical protein